MSKNSTFVMPAVGTPEHDALQKRWESKPISFNQCSKIKTLFKLVEQAGGYHGKVNAKYAARLDYLSTRDENNRWPVLRTDNPNLNMTFWQGHKLMETLEALAAGGPVEVTKSEPKPAADVQVGPFKAAAPEAIKPVNYTSGDFILVDGEAFVVNRVGKRAYLAAVPAKA